MQIVIDIPDEQVKKSLEESKYINEDEGEKGFVHISMLYTNAQLEFVDVERKTDFYSCEYKILPKRHGALKDSDLLDKRLNFVLNHTGGYKKTLIGTGIVIAMAQNLDVPTIIEADKAESEKQA